MMTDTIAEMIAGPDVDRGTTTTTTMITNSASVDIGKSIVGL